MHVTSCRRLSVRLLQTANTVNMAFCRREKVGNCFRFIAKLAKAGLVFTYVMVLFEHSDSCYAFCSQTVRLEAVSVSPSGF